VTGTESVRADSFARGVENGTEALVQAEELFLLVLANHVFTLAGPPFSKLERLSVGAQHRNQG